MFKKFQNWMKFNPPAYGTIDEWNDFDKLFKQRAPYRYFVCNTFPKKCIWPVTRRIERMRDWVRYRIVRYHVLHTGLEAGYYDKDTLMLNANFNLLKDFVEIEKGWMEHICHDAELDIHPVLQYIPYYTRATFRSRELGEKYLEWEMTLNDPERGADINEEQARVAKEISELYRWWIDARPNRVELEFEYSDADEDEGIFHRLSEKYKEEHPAETKAFAEYCEASTAQEEAWAKEDEEMLIRLIKVRKHLWT